MSDETLRFLLQILAVFLGGGSVQLIIAVIRRKSELRKINTSADVDEAVIREKASSAQDKLIEALQHDGQVYRELTRDLQAKVERLEEREQRAQLDFARQLRDAHGENSRLSTRIAQLQTDVDILTRQNDEYRRRT